MRRGDASIISARNAVRAIGSVTRLSSLDVALCAADTRVDARVADVEAETGDVDVAVAPDEEGAEDGLGHDVEDAVEDSLGVGGDDVAALGQAPGDRVQEPQENGPHAADEVDLGDVGAEGAGVGAAFEDDLGFVRMGKGGLGVVGKLYSPGDEEEGNAAEGVVSPLVGALDESANEASDDHDLIDQDGVEDGWSWQTAGQEQVEQQKWCGDDPVDVSDLGFVSLQVDLPVLTLLT